MALTYHLGRVDFSGDYGPIQTACGLVDHLYCETVGPLGPLARDAVLGGVEFLRAVVNWDPEETGQHAYKLCGVCQHVRHDAPVTALAWVDIREYDAWEYPELFEYAHHDPGDPDVWDDAAVHDDGF